MLTLVSRPNLSYVPRSILTAHKTDGVTVWGHQCNTIGRWEGGLHKLIGQPNAFPEVVRAYLDRHTERAWQLGEMEVYETHVPGLRLAYLAGQEQIGNAARTGRRYTNYKALEHALRLLHAALREDDVIAFPLVGAGLAGGDWTFISYLIHHTFHDRQVLVFVVEPFTVVSEWVIGTADRPDAQVDKGERCRLIARWTKDGISHCRLIDECGSTFDSLYQHWRHEPIKEQRS